MVTCLCFQERKFLKGDASMKRKVYIDGSLADSMMSMASDFIMFRMKDGSEKVVSAQDFKAEANKLSDFHLKSAD